MLINIYGTCASFVYLYSDVMLLHEYLQMLNSSGKLDEQAKADLQLRIRILKLQIETEEAKKQLASSGNRR